MKTTITHLGQRYELSLKAGDAYTVEITGPHGQCIVSPDVGTGHSHGRVKTEEGYLTYFVSKTRLGYWVSLGGETTLFERAKPMAGASHDEAHAGFEAPMPGKIVELTATAGDLVPKGAVLMLMEAMKMEHRIEAPCSGRVTRFHYSVGDLVDMGATLLDFDADEDSTKES